MWVEKMARRLYREVKQFRSARFHSQAQAGSIAQGLMPSLIPRHLRHRSTRSGRARSRVPERSKSTSSTKQRPITNIRFIPSRVGEAGGRLKRNKTAGNIEHPAWVLPPLRGWKCSALAFPGLRPLMRACPGLSSVAPTGLDSWRRRDQAEEQPQDARFIPRGPATPVDD